MSDLCDLMTRVEALERYNQRLTGENRLLKGAGVTLIVAAASLLLLGHHQSGLAEEKKEKTVEAEKFILRDANKRIRAAIHVGPNGPKYDLYDEKEVLRATLALGKKGSPVLAFFSDQKKSQVTITAEEDKRYLALHGENGEARALFGFFKDGSLLGLADKKGEFRVALTDNPEGRGFAVQDDNGKNRILFTLEKDKPTLKLLDAKQKELFRKP